MSTLSCMFCGGPAHIYPGRDPVPACEVCARGGPDAPLSPAEVAAVRRWVEDLDVCHTERSRKHFRELLRTIAWYQRMARQDRAEAQGIWRIQFLRAQAAEKKLRELESQRGVPASTSTRDDFRVATAKGDAGAPRCDSPAPHSPESWAQQWDTLGYRKLTPAFVLAIQTKALADFDQHFKALYQACKEETNEVDTLRAKLAAAESAIARCGKLNADLIRRAEAAEALAKESKK
jgi:hypothetical protein